MTTTLDCKGMPCPQPVIATKDALEEDSTDKLRVIVDNEASLKNVERFANSQNCDVITQNLEEGCFQLTITKRSGSSSQKTATVREEDYVCDIPNESGLVYVIAADTMGRGDDELGWGLMQTYIQTIKDVQPQPKKILFYNSGVKLVSQESGALNALRKLQNQGVQILACGTCLDFFKLKAKIKVGKISNMYDIMSSMNESSRVISPF